MNNFDKLNNLKYQQMQREYSKLLTPEINKYLDNLNLIIYSLEINGFNMSLLMQNQIYSTLLEVKQILNTLSINKPSIKQKQIIKNNPIILLLNLNKLSQQLNQHALKSPFYLILNKANNLILNCTDKILNYFLNNKFN